MKIGISILLLALATNGLWGAPASPQPGAGGMGSLHALAPGTPKLSRHFARLFGEHPVFAANLNSEVTRGTDTFTSEAKVSFLEGKVRMEVDVTKSKGAALPPRSMESLARFGLHQLVILDLPPHTNLFLIYPAPKAYADIASTNPPGPANVKMETTRLGEEDLNGQPCVKNKVTFSTSGGALEELIVWNATRLKNFPVQIETADETFKVKMTLSEVRFERPEAALFEPPADYMKFDNVQALIQGAVIRRMQGGRALPGQ